MPYVKVTDSLRTVIKSERKKRGLRGDTLSKNIGKSSSYISLLERGNIDTIEVSLFYNLFKNIIDLPEENFADYLTNVLKDSSLNFTKEEIEHEQWIKNFELQYRLFPITDELITYIKTEINNLNPPITPKELVIEINKNKGLSDGEKKDIKPNFVNVSFDETGFKGYSILFNLPLDAVDKIISKKTESINYINMLGILYNIHILKGMSSTDAMFLSNKILDKNNFITIRKRNRILKSKIQDELKNRESKDIDIIELLDSDTEKDFAKAFDSIKKNITSFRDANLPYATKTMLTFDKNLREETPITYAILNRKFYKLKHLSRDKKIEFLSKIKDLINEYATIAESNNNER